MTNKSFIVKYVFIVDIDENENKNFDTNLNKRESFNDTSFNAIVAQKICVFDVANDILNKINSIKLDIKFFDVVNEVKIVDEVEKIWIIANLFANEINSLENEIDKDFASFFANFWWWSCTCWCSLILLENLIKQRL